MIASKQLEEEHKDTVQHVLLSRHRHQHQKKGLSGIRSLADIGKKGSAKNLEGKGGSRVLAWWGVVAIIYLYFSTCFMRVWDTCLV